MRKVSALLATSLLVVSLATTGTAFASPGLCYYSFSNPWGSAGYKNSIDSPTFTVTNSSNVVTISGWQDTPSAGIANVDYELRKSAFIGSSNVATITIAGNFPKNGTWYSHTYTYVSTGSGYFIRMTPRASSGMDGAGNAYDGY